MTGVNSPSQTAIALWDESRVDIVFDCLIDDLWWDCLESEAISKAKTKSNKERIPKKPEIKPSTKKHSEYFSEGWEKNLPNQVVRKNEFIITERK